MDHGALVARELGISHDDRADRRADRRLFPPVPRRLAAPPRQQDGAGADDRPVRPIGRAGRAGPRHEQQDRAADRLRDDPRRHGVGAATRSATCTRRRSAPSRAPWASPRRSSARTRPPTSGSARPTRPSWASPTPRSIASLMRMVDERARVDDLIADGFDPAFVTKIAQDGAGQPLQAPAPADRQALVPDDRPRLPVCPRLGDVGWGRARPTTLARERLILRGHRPGSRGGGHRVDWRGRVCRRSPGRSRWRSSFESRQALTRIRSSSSTATTPSWSAGRRRSSSRSPRTVGSRASIS